METIRRAKWAYLIISALMIALGVCMILWPGMSAALLCSVLGIVILLFGVVKLFGYFSKDRFGLAFQFDFALGVFLVLAGMLMMLHPQRIVTATPVILGVFILVDGAFKLQTAMDAQRFGLERWWLILLLAILTSLCGLVLILSPFEGALALMTLMGVTLIIDGGQNLCVVAYTVRTEKKKNF